MVEAMTDDLLARLDPYYAPNKEATAEAAARIRELETQLAYAISEKAAELEADRAMTRALCKVDFEELRERYERLRERYERLRELAEAIPKDWGEQPSVTGTGDYDHGMMCGVEDRGYQTDGYSAMRYGYDRALERVAEVIEEPLKALLAELERR